ncbi:MAG: RrF2 family transcriptional regulator [Candidatus Binatia bacterium]
MKIGSKGFYGILAMADLVRTRRTGKPVQVKEIAQRQKIPEEYLGHIMVLLKRADLVRGTRGPGGGYYLARPPETISVGTVLRVLDGPLMDPGMKGQKGQSATSLVAQRLLQAWGKALHASEQILEEVTLADLCRPDNKIPMYYI